MLARVSAFVNRFHPGATPAAKRIGPRPEATMKLKFHSGVRVSPFLPQEVGLLTKDNWIVRNEADPTGFNHFLAHLVHPRNVKPDRPVLILVPGMLCNANLFRICRLDGNFRNLNTNTSFANALAFEGYHVVLVHPRYARWVYQRYVKEKLGVANQFSEATTFDQMVNDLSFHIDAALGLTGCAKAAVVGFSMGGMELLNMLAFRQIDPRLAAAVFLSTPVEFAHNKETLISLLRWYGTAAQYAPIKEYHALNIVARNVIFLKDALKYLADKTSPKIMRRVIKDLPLISQIFNPEETDPETIIPFAFYVLEPMPPTLINNLLRMVRQGQLISPTWNAGYLASLKPSLPHSLVITGKEDALVTAASDQALFDALGQRNSAGTTTNRKVRIPKAGHVDAVAGMQSERVLLEIVNFLNEIK
ncbi:MAG: alpha/beta hydrolase [Candidatus Margulisbacteria bacterium]|nr:alpha/beta hydrolase [Candidatus Margulisiibacteriota bacterium]